MAKAKKLSTGAKIGIGAGAAIAAAGATYFLASKNAKAHRAKAKDLYTRAKTDVAHEVKKLKKLGQADYERLVSSVMKTYAALKKDRPEELMHVANELKAGWSKLEKKAATSARRGKKAVTKAVRSVSKKPATKKKRG